MRLIRWFFMLIVVVAATVLALLLLALLLLGFGAFKIAGLTRVIAPRARESLRGDVARASDSELPEAPPDVAIHHLRSWDAARNRAVDRWYYKDSGGQWVFVRAPGPA